MKKILGALWLAMPLPACASDCLEPQALRQLDAAYEEALRVGDVKLLEALLAPEYLWVHNLASQKENRAQLLARMDKPAEIPKARRSGDITIQRLGDTAVLQGLSRVEKWNTDGKSFRSMDYQFMRTYAKQGDKCLLLAVQTMKIWSSDGN